MNCYGYRRFPLPHGCYAHSVFYKKKNTKRMRYLLPFLTLVFLAGSVIVGILYVIARFLSQINFNPESQAWKKTVEGLRARLKTQAAGALVPWDGEMLSLLSLNRSITKKPGFFNSASEGVFTTIFQEPVLAYAEQKSGNTGVLIARTSDREFIFRKKGKEIEIWLNGQPFGVLVDGSLLSAGRSPRLLARLESKSDEVQFPVLLGDKTVAAIANPLKTDSPNPRALALLRALSAEEESAVLALTVFVVVR